LGQQKPEILFYGRTRFCPDVARSRGRLSALGIEWTEFDIEADEVAAQKVEAMTGMRRVPTIVIGEAILVEPTNTALDAALEAAGYDIEEEEVA
jgi:glutaredoxin